MPASHSPAPAELASTGRRERKRQQTVEHIAAVAWNLFEAHGFDGVTMEAVADAADVAKGTLYKHFPTKEALLRPSLHAQFARQLAAAQSRLARLPSPSARLRGFLKGWAAAVITQRHYMAPYLRHRMGEMGETGRPGPSGRTGIDRVLLAMIADGQRAGELRTDLPADLLTDHLQAMMLTATLRWLKRPDVSLPKEAQRACDLFIRGAEQRA